MCRAWPASPSVASDLDGVAGLDAIAICTPPQVRYEIAHLALVRGKHVLLEKPPCPSLVQLEHLIGLAQGRGREALYQSWHSQHARALPLLERTLF